VCEPRLPAPVLFIIGNEFWRALLLYGMRAILALYLNEQLHLSGGRLHNGNRAPLSSVFPSPLPFLGAFISDSFWVSSGGQCLPPRPSGDSLLLCLDAWTVAVAPPVPPGPGWWVIWCCCCVLCAARRRASTG